MNYKSLSVLASSELLERQLWPLPSWVPDWSIVRKTARLGWSSFSASLGTSAMVKFESSLTELHVAGIYVDTIGGVGSPWSLHQSKGAGARDVAIAAGGFLLDMERLARLKKEQNINIKCGSIAEAVWSTSTAGLELADDGKWRKGAFSSRGYKETIEYYNRTHNEVKCNSEGEFLFGAEAKRFHSTLSVRCVSRRAFVTKDGYLGLGPDAIQAGDIVVVLLGSNVPFILRESVKNKFQLVGECYVYGIMNGEIMAKNQQTESLLIV
jgi:hypothetical protein